VTLIDRYGNRFVCRADDDDDDGDDDDGDKDGGRTPELPSQPIVSPSNPDHVRRFGEEFVRRYGRRSSSSSSTSSSSSSTPDRAVECLGIDYVEFTIPPGAARRIATFYEGVFDATASVLLDGDDAIALIGVGRVDPETGRASQTILYRETTTTTATDEEGVGDDVIVPPYDGHHIALYVGRSGEDFERAFENCDLAGAVWTNPRFRDEVTDLEGAREEGQFRFKDLMDLRTGRTVFELEHEIRSVEHDSWPGRKE